MKYVIYIAMVLGMAAPVQAQDTTPEQRLSSEGHKLPSVSAPVANYVKWRRAGNILYLSGHGECGDALTGKLGAGLTVKQGYDSAQRVGLCMLATIKGAVGDLSKVKQVLQIMGMVNASPDFTQQPQVINGFSDLFVVAFGDAGKGARAAVGMSSLPSDIAVEISAVIELNN